MNGIPRNRHFALSLGRNEFVVIPIARVRLRAQTA
jgi:hypothetical protein